MTEENKTQTEVTETKESNTSKEVKVSLPEIKVGSLVKVHQKIKELDAKGNPKERVQIFEGIVIAHHAGKEKGATFTVRKIAADAVGVEKIYPLHSPTLVKVELVKQHKVRRAKLYYLRSQKKHKKMKEIK
ncbi:MAG: 50S ribosomal protein L19 [Patescibacteria group bacterium]|nr:50S ribosomal protein L19 [Patescibacteria group bacterium]MDD5121224.1 50S ribosomal protein L19 [Patescibacteria group bacterium]MDD5221747.1 50S ribosomal protein L19 [Patescibacteria group bacterium]MDD5395857.1 50S ribosomal protein L19 [Patescibacteria group bacterium]